MTDLRPVHVKLVKVSGHIHFVSVLPPSEIKSDETVHLHGHHSKGAHHEEVSFEDYMVERISDRRIVSGTEPANRIGDRGKGRYQTNYLV